MTKVCSRCCLEKDLALFARSKVHRLGVGPWCRDCDRVYRLQRRKQIAARRRAHYLANAELVRARTSEYRRSHPDRVNASNRSWRQRNPEKAQAISRRACARWARLNPAGRLAKASRRRARASALPVAWTERDARRTLSFFGSRCAFCQRPGPLAWDHWVPLAAPTCPGTVPWNLVPLCRSCNCSKGGRLPSEWLARRSSCSKAVSAGWRIEQYLLDQVPHASPVA